MRCAVILADDSGSMKAMENGERIQDLEAMLARIAGITEKPLKIHLLIEMCDSNLFCNRQSFFTGIVFTTVFLSTRCFVLFQGFGLI